MNVLATLGKLGRTLQLPIAVLPAAALLLRFGQPDLLNLAFMADAGNAIFANLPLIFAIGVAIGWSKDSAGSAALAGAVAYLIMSAAMKSIDTDINMGVLAGIVSGLVGGMCYNRFSQINLPSFLAFFGGKRFVPIVSGLVALVLATIFGYLWPTVQAEIKTAGEWIVGQGALGAGIFATVNRLLIPTGLHLLINTIAWFEIGTFIDPITQVVSKGDIARFYAGDTTAGMFMAGFYPVIMFGLPAAALAMYHAAPLHRRAQVGGLLFSTAFTAFLTGVTEPFEFLFMFLAPLLYLIHAFLTGLSAYFATLFEVHAGFTFSAGAIDFLLMMNLPAASRTYVLLIMGGIWAVMYYMIFSIAIRVFDLKTPGREEEESNIGQTDNMEIKTLAEHYAVALGGIQNLTTIDACITRLRLVVKDMNQIDEAACKRLGASGLIRLPDNNLQIVIGAKAEMVSDILKKIAQVFSKTGEHAVQSTHSTEVQPPQAASVLEDKTPSKSDYPTLKLDILSPMIGEVVALEEVADPVFADKIIGDGIAIIPAEGKVVAPCDGIITTLFHTYHAFVIEANNGAHIMVHVGLDTVQLNGEGFTPQVKEGDRVTAGQTILLVDLEVLKVKAKSLMTPVVIVNSDDIGVRVQEVRLGLTQQGQIIYTLDV